MSGPPLLRSSPPLFSPPTAGPTVPAEVLLLLWASRSPGPVPPTAGPPAAGPTVSAEVFLLPVLLDLLVLLLLPLTPPAVVTLHKRDTETPEQVFGDQVTQCLGLHAAPEGPRGCCGPAASSRRTVNTETPTPLSESIFYSETGATGLHWSAPPPPPPDQLSRRCLARPVAWCGAPRPR